MPPFKYEAFVNPYIGSISELMGKRGDIDAEAVTRVGDIQAADIARRGQAWGSAVEGLGNIAGKAFADYAQAKKDAPRLAEEALLRQERVSAANDASQLRRGQEFMGTFRQKPDPNYLPNPATGESRLQGPAAPDNRNIYKPGKYGSQVMDYDLTQQTLVDAGFGAHLEKLMPIVDRQNTRNTNFLAEKAKVMGQTAQDALTILRTTQGDGSPTKYRTAVEFAGNSLVKNNVIRAEDLADVIAQGEQLDPAGQEAFLLNLMKQGGAEITYEPFDQTRLVGGTFAGTTGAKPATTTLGNPVAMMEDGQQVTVQEVKRSDGTSTWIHLDKTPVTGRLTGMPGKQEDVMRGGTRTPILEGTRRPGDLPVPTPQAPQAPSWDVLTDPTTGKQRYVAKGSKEAAGLMQQGWMAGNGSNRPTRPVSSVDANRLAEFETSLDDTVVLRTVIGDVGTISRLGASMPTWVTELTGGWGSDAKSQNAVIARVKQVIGKALEGGVLRKEDEEKYKDILPTIGDPKSVALNKLDGLEAAIAKRKTRVMEALEDAEFDVSRYRTRDVETASRAAGLLNSKVSDLLKSTGRDSSPASIKAFLSANPGFR